MLKKSTFELYPCLSKKKKIIGDPLELIFAAINSGREKGEIVNTKV